jgi:hypothetical protein
MALYVELDATSLNGEQYWYDQYTVGEPLIAAAKSEATSDVKSGSSVLRLSSGVSSSTSTTLSGYERLLQFTAGLVEANSTLINNSNYISSSSVVHFPESETESHPNVLLNPRGSLINSNSTVYVNGRKKWESEDVNSESWTELSVNSESWTKLSTNTENWIKVN